MFEPRIRIPELHPAQAQIKRERRRFNVIDCGRRFGKNILFQEMAVDGALVEHGPVGWGAPTYKMLLDDWKNLSNILAPVTTRRNEQEKSLMLVGNGSIEMFSLDNPNGVRGKKFKRFIVNEAAFVPDLLDIWNMIVRPTLVDLRGSCDFGGTPKGMNAFWQLYNQTGDDWAHWQMSSYSNPHIPKAELDALRDTMLERAFAQEILAQFLEDGGGVFRNVRASATAQPAEPIKGSQYVIGVDWGRTGDATVFCVIDVNTRTQVALDRMTDTDYASQRLRLQALAKKYDAPILAEANSIGQPNIEALQDAGLSVHGFTTTNATKAQVIQALELAFEKHDITTLAHELQTAELMAYQSEKLPSGLIRYGAPEGMHDDTVIALALAWWAASRRQPAAVDISAMDW